MRTPPTEELLFFKEHRLPATGELCKDVDAVISRKVVPALVERWLPRLIQHLRGLHKRAERSRLDIKGNQGSQWSSRCEAVKWLESKQIPCLNYTTWVVLNEGR